jgi:hypothetical protein
MKTLMNATKPNHLLGLAALSLVVALVISGCDQNAFDENLGIPDGEGTPWVEFGETEDTIAIFKSDTEEIDIEVPVRTEDFDVTATYEISGDAVLGTDFSIPASTDVTDTLSTQASDIERDIRIDPDNPGPIDLNDLEGQNITITDTLSDGTLVGTQIVYEVQRYSTTFDEANQTGSVTIGSSDVFVLATDEAIVELQGESNAAATEPLSVTFELISAEGENGETVQVGRQGTTESGTGISQNRLTVLIGQAEPAVVVGGSLTNLVNFGPISEPDTLTASVFNLGGAFGIGSGDLPTTLSNFRLEGSNPEAFTFDVTITSGDGEVIDIPNDGEVTVVPNGNASIAINAVTDAVGTKTARLVFDVSNDFDQESLSVEISSVVEAP